MTVNTERVFIVRYNNSRKFDFLFLNLHRTNIEETLYGNTYTFKANKTKPYKQKQTDGQADIPPTHQP